MKQRDYIIPCMRRYDILVNTIDIDEHSMDMLTEQKDVFTREKSLAEA